MRPLHEVKTSMHQQRQQVVPGSLVKRSKSSWFHFRIFIFLLHYNSIFTTYQQIYALLSTFLHK